MVLVVMFYVFLHTFLIFIYVASPGDALTHLESKLRVKGSLACTMRIHDFMSSATSSHDKEPDIRRRATEDSARHMSSRRSLVKSGIYEVTKAAGLVVASSPFFAEAASARLEPVNRPDLLPKEPGLNVIQTEKFLTTGQAKRLNELLAKLEKDTSFRVRVLCQAYPNTPGLAIRDYWDLGKEGQKDDKYVVLVVDQFGGRGNVLNFNVGDGVKFALPNVFWTRLQGKYGSTFYVRENGIDLAIVNAIEAIAQCLRAEYCVNVPDEGPSLRSLGMM